MKPMTVAVAGYGWWGKQLVKSASLTPKLKVAVVVDPKPPADIHDGARQFGFRLESDFDKILADKSIDGVILASPNAFHLPQTLAAFEAGKYVFCEKPLTMTGEGAKVMLGAAKKAGKVLGIGHELRYLEPVEALIETIGNGTIGRLLSMEVNRSHDTFRNLPKDNWRKNPDPSMSPGGLYTGTGIHQTDIFCLIAGEPAEVRAETDTLVYDPPAEDYVRVKIIFRSGVHAMYSALSCTPYYSRFTAFGDKGWVELVADGAIDKNKPMHLTVSTVPGERTTRTFAATADNSVKDNLEAWVDANLGGGAHRFTPQQMIDNTRIFEALVRSARNGGQTVKL